MRVKIPRAPEAGAVNVTQTFGTALTPSLIDTVIESGKKEPATVDCGVPLVTVMPDGDPGSFVRTNEAGAATPATVAPAAYVPEVLFATSVAAWRASTP